MLKTSALPLDVEELNEISFLKFLLPDPTAQPPLEQQHGVGILHIVAVLVLLVGTYFSIPPAFTFGATITTWHVWWYGWITCISTGFGALPFLCATNIPKRILALSNAVAAGMMLTASGSMSYEAFYLPQTDHSSYSPPTRLIMGLCAGIVFIIVTQKLVEGQEDTAFEQLQGANARKALLIMAVMFLHSFAEGVGIGVSFGGDAPPHLGLLISATLAVHNIPEGLAISLVLIPKGLGTLQTCLWCVFSSIPQPVMAVPAYIFIESFTPWLPIGLGFAAGAMVYVAFFGNVIPQFLNVFLEI